MNSTFIKRPESFFGYCLLQAIDRTAIQKSSENKKLLKSSKFYDSLNSPPTLICWLIHDSGFDNIGGSS